MDTLQSDYRDMLINLGELVDENKNYLDSMKFKCKSFIKGKESEGITSALQLWTALEKRELIGPQNTTFLKDLLRTCMRGIMPPLRVLENYEAQVGLHGQQRPQIQNIPFQQQQYPQAPPQVVYVQAGHQFHNIEDTGNEYDLYRLNKTEKGCSICIVEILHSFMMIHC